MNRDAAIEAGAMVLEDERRIRHDEDCEQDPDAIAPGCRCARRAAAAVIDTALPHLVGRRVHPRLHELLPGRAVSAAEWLDRVDALAREVAAPLPDDARMDAYYYGFNRTGVGVVDAVLSAVAVAGKGSHHTESWSDEDDHYGYYTDRPGLDPNHPDGSAVDLIQRTAARSAERVTAAVSLVPAMSAALRAVLDLHQPWYIDASGVRQDHAVFVSGEDIPADHVCRIGQFEHCFPELDEHYTLACIECRGATEEGMPGFDLWPCATRRAITDALEAGRP